VNALKSEKRMLEGEKQALFIMVQEVQGEKVRAIAALNQQHEAKVEALKVNHSNKIETLEDVRRPTLRSGIHKALSSHPCSPGCPWQALEKFRDVAIATSEALTPTKTELREVKGERDTAREAVARLRDENRNVIIESVFDSVIAETVARIDRQRVIQVRHGRDDGPRWGQDSKARVSYVCAGGGEGGGAADSRDQPLHLRERGSLAHRRSIGKGRTTAP
jgi:hypothetical protein